MERRCKVYGLRFFRIASEHNRIREAIPVFRSNSHDASVLCAARSEAHQPRVLIGNHLLLDNCTHSCKACAVRCLSVKTSLFTYLESLVKKTSFRAIGQPFNQSAPYSIRVGAMVYTVNSICDPNAPHSYVRKHSQYQQYADNANCNAREEVSHEPPAQNSRFPISSCPSRHAQTLVSMVVITE